MTHSTRIIFLAVIKLLETHQYSRPHSCISFLLNVTGQNTICPVTKNLNKYYYSLNSAIYVYVSVGTVNGSNFRVFKFILLDCWLCQKKRVSRKRCWKVVVSIDISVIAKLLTCSLWSKLQFSFKIKKALLNNDCLFDQFNNHLAIT